MEALQREVARLKDENKIEKEKAKKARGQLNKERDEKVHDEYLNLDASKAKSLSSNLLSKFGREEKPIKDEALGQKTRKRVNQS